MRIVSWNCRRATATSPLWDYLAALQPDLALLQEVGNLPSAIMSHYHVLSRPARTEHGTPQRFSSAMLSRHSAPIERALTPAQPWVARLLAEYAGNVIAADIAVPSGPPLTAVLVYSPPWPVPPAAYAGEDITGVRLRQNPALWVNDLVTAALQTADVSTTDWIIGGDFNSCELIDQWKRGPRGNREWLERMRDLGLVECVQHRYGKLVPTLKGRGTKPATYQIDKLFVTARLAESLQTCVVGDAATVFGMNLSDHLPIIADVAIERAILP